ncbi:hypothetical protein ERO13_D08G079100v2 [Gossypium hirsutum]|uniref:Protein PALE CRESS, chloroplastic isoform X6 n=1 Tax=Gossypium hirsutum TaxID=3635 RepID=A0ABM3AM14_GOSHI|nr:protein PALE CRESS, chloroplastic-like isoform X6 [Gossypium hirsutum]KAG4133172.1 hypothetical protein ERO13_D08G079100v2 [Gossypium hirsutum]
MEAKLFLLTCSLPLQPLLPTCNMRLSRFKTTSPSKTVLRRCMNQEEQLLEGMPKEYYDDEWQARQREKTKELHRRRREEEEEEERKVEEYREIGMRLKGYPQEDVVRARKLVSSFIRAEEEVEEDEKDAIRSLDLLYRRVEEASPAMRLLNDLLNMHDGFDNEGWLKECKKRMVETFPREDPFSILVPAGFDIDKHHGPLSLPAEADDVLLRVDFIREVDALLQEVRSEQNEAQTPDELDPESVAVKLKEHERKRTIRQVETLLDLAINLQW